MSRSIQQSKLIAVISIIMYRFSLKVGLDITRLFFLDSVRVRMWHMTGGISTQVMQRGPIY